MILIADEDVDTRIILRTVLERRDCVVVEAGSADAAVFEAGLNRFDLVILNYPMMCADGESLVRCLRAMPQTRSVPILNVTSRVIPQFLEEAAVQGVTATIPKPIDVEQITGLIDRLTQQPIISAS